MAVLAFVLADMPEPVNLPGPPEPTDEPADVPTLVAAAPAPVVEPVDESVAEASETADEPVLEPVEEGPVHRQLIRATLPRTEGQQKERQLPDFTIRQNNGPRGHFRGQRAHGGGTGNGTGNRPHGGRRFGGGNPNAMPGRGGGVNRGGGGFRTGTTPQQRHGGPKKRSR